MPPVPIKTEAPQRTQRTILKKTERRAADKSRKRVSFNDENAELGESEVDYDPPPTTPIELSTPDDSASDGSHAPTDTCSDDDDQDTRPNDDPEILAKDPEGSDDPDTPPPPAATNESAS